MKGPVEGAFQFMGIKGPDKPIMARDKFVRTGESERELTPPGCRRPSSGPSGWSGKPPWPSPTASPATLPTSFALSKNAHVHVL